MSDLQGDPTNEPQGGEVPKPSFFSNRNNVKVLATFAVVIATGLGVYLTVNNTRYGADTNPPEISDPKVCRIDEEIQPAVESQVLLPPGPTDPIQPPTLQAIVESKFNELEPDQRHIITNPESYPTEVVEDAVKRLTGRIAGEALEPFYDRIASQLWSTVRTAFGYSPKEDHSGSGTAEKESESKGSPINFSLSPKINDGELGARIKIEGTMIETTKLRGTLSAGYTLCPGSTTRGEGTRGASAAVGAEFLFNVKGPDGRILVSITNHSAGETSFSASAVFPL